VIGAITAWAEPATPSTALPPPAAHPPGVSSTASSAGSGGSGCRVDSERPMFPVDAAYGDPAWGVPCALLRLRGQNLRHARNSRRGVM
jgi:hypothetical protein